MNVKVLGYIIGFTAQLLFAARVLVQWIKSEQVKRVFNPTSFWVLSLIAAFLMFIYGWLREDFAIILGQSLTYFIYIRNLQLKNVWYKIPMIARGLLLLIPMVIIFYFYFSGQVGYTQLFKNENIPMWLLIWGSIGQLVFTFRFIYQWIYSEKMKESVLPLGFWILSLVGSLMILSYAIIRRDPVLFLGQSFGFIVYIRNIILWQKSKKISLND